MAGAWIAKLGLAPRRMAAKTSFAPIRPRHVPIDGTGPVVAGGTDQSPAGHRASSCRNIVRPFERFCSLQLSDQRTAWHGLRTSQSVHLLSLLHEVKRRSEAVSRFRAFISESGKTKAGRNRPLAPDQIDERVACASAIKVARQLLTEEPLTLRQGFVRATVGSSALGAARPDPSGH